MPYPLEKLAYGLRRRLRELATGAETYAFQIAAPNYYGIQPIQKVLPIGFVKFKVDDTTNLLIQPPDVLKCLDVDHLIQSCFYLKFENFNANSPQLFLERYVLAPKLVTFNNCVIDSTFVQTLLSRMEQQVFSIRFYGCTIPGEEVAKVISAVNAFKSLDLFCLYNCETSLNDWIDGFLKTKSSTIMNFSIFDATASVFETNKKKFFKFFRAQNSKFQMFIRMRDRSMKSEKQLNAFFWPLFKKLSKKPRKLRKYVLVQHGSGVIRYYILRKMLKYYDDDLIFKLLN